MPTPALSTMTVGQWLEHYIAHFTGLAKSTLADYRSYTRNDIAPVVGPIPLTALSSDDIASWMQAMADARKSGKTISNEHGFLSSALNVRSRPGASPSNPAAGHRMPRTEKADMMSLLRAEFGKLLDSVTEHWRPLVEFLVASGCRWSEATALRPSDVDREAGTVGIVRAWKRTYAKGGYELGPPKTKRSIRTINVPASVLAKLDYSGERLFTNWSGDRCAVMDFMNGCSSPPSSKREVASPTARDSPPRWCWASTHEHILDGVSLEALHRSRRRCAVMRGRRSAANELR